jgi:ribosome-associated protein
VHLRFDINASSLPDFYKKRLLNYRDKRITKDGIIIIKSQEFRSQEKNKEEAFIRLRDIIIRATTIQKNRRATRPSRNSQKRRMDNKSARGKIKANRKKVDY